MFRIFSHQRSISAFIAIVLLTNVFVLSVFADPLPLVMAPEQAPAGKIIIPDGTPIKLLLDDELKSGSCHPGDRVDYELENDWYTTDRQLIAPAGTKAVGHVIDSHGHGMFGKPGKLTIAVDYILDPDRTHIIVRGTQAGGGGKNEIGGMVAVMAFVSLIGGMFIEGRDVNLHKGMEITMYVDGDQYVMPYDTVLAENGITAPGVDNNSPTKTLFILNDGTQIIGIQNAFDGTNYAVTTDQGIKLIPAANVKSKFALASDTAASAPIAIVSATPTAPQIYEFTLIDGSKYYGTIVTGDSTVPSGFTKIQNNVKTRLFKNSSITSQNPVKDDVTAQADGFKE